MHGIVTVCDREGLIMLPYGVRIDDDGVDGTFKGAPP
jgi:hypothetical protein